MPDYKKMYYKLFNEITDVIEHLKQIQLETKEIYTSGDPVNLCEIEKTEK